MASTLEYALMAGDAYISNRSSINLFPIPKGWNEFFHVPNNPAYPNFTSTSGFEAVSFQNSANPNEIVISYAGTDPKSIGDLYADGTLAAGVSSATLISQQILQAADYYLTVQASNPKANITFTGHSLGGGLASLMAVFFNKQAVTFDQAPFRNSASLAVAQQLYSYLAGEKITNGQSTYSASQLQGLATYISAVTAAPGSVPYEANVKDINVQGEFLSSSLDLFSRIGSQSSISDSSGGVSGLDLHSQALLAAFEQSKQTAATGGKALNDVTVPLPDLLRMMFDSNLYAYPENTTNKTNPNILDLLVNHQAGFDPRTQAAIAGGSDNMVTRFTSDLWNIAQAGGLTMSDKNLTDALIAFDMQKYYYEKAGASNDTAWGMAA